MIPPTTTTKFLMIGNGHYTHCGTPAMQGRYSSAFPSCQPLSDPRMDIRKVVISPTPPRSASITPWGDRGNDAAANSVAHGECRSGNGARRRLDFVEGSTEAGRASRAFGGRIGSARDVGRHRDRTSSRAADLTWLGAGARSALRVGSADISSGAAIGGRRAGVGYGGGRSPAGKRRRDLLGAEHPSGAREVEERGEDDQGHLYGRDPLPSRRSFARAMPECGIKGSS
jgi:hypothetical protein